MTGLTIAVVTAFVVFMAKRRPYLLTGWFWYLITLAPMSGLFIQVGSQGMADRYAYLSIVGPLFAVVWAAANLAAVNRRARLAVIVLSMATILGFSTAARFQVAFWRNDRALFEHALRVNPENYFAYLMLGKVLMLEGDAAGAEARYRKALDVEPDCTPALVNLGNLALAEGKSAAALTYYERAQRLDRSMAEVENGIGTALLRLSRTTDALPHLERAVRLKPDLVEARLNLGAALERLGLAEDARARYREAVRVNPGDPRLDSALVRVERRIRERR